MGFNFDFMLVALKAAIKYTPITIMLAIIPFIFGLIFGTFIAIARVFKVKIIGRISQIYVVIIKGIPLVLVLYILYFGLTQYFDVIASKLHLKIHSKDIKNIYVAYTALSLFAISNISEVIRGALVAVDKGQYEAAYSAGLTKSQTLRSIILPQAFPVAIPMLCSSFIGLIKGSSLAFLVSVTDLMNGALITATANYNFLEAYIAAAIVYWLICIVIERASYLLEKYFKSYIKVGVL